MTVNHPGLGRHVSNTATRRADWPGVRVEVVAGVRALVWEENTGLKVLMALEAGFK